MVQRPDAILIAGPTASGKTRHALELANQFDGEIVNADSMQVYPVLRVLTARPDDDELAQAPHHLYGHAAIEKPYSVARWIADVEGVLVDLKNRDKVPIFVGGTGLYFRALLEGLSPVPDIPEHIRNDVRASLIEEGSEALHLKLQQLDHEAAARLAPGDSHRIARALEVVLATGNPLSVHHAQDDGLGGILSGIASEKVILLPGKPILHERIHQRADLMMKFGAVEEVEKLLSLNLPSEATVLKAIGVKQISSFLEGNISFPQVLELLKTATRQYAKRQSTWFRNQFDDSWKIIF